MVGVREVGLGGTYWACRMPLPCVPVNASLSERAAMNADAEGLCHLQGPEDESHRVVAAVARDLKGARTAIDRSDNTREMVAETRSDPFRRVSGPVPRRDR